MLIAVLYNFDTYITEKISSFIEFTMVELVNSEYKINSAEERYFWVSYFAFVLLSSVIGDTLILVGSIKHGAMKLNKLLVVVIQHLAVSDLIQSIVFVLPTIVFLCADGWVFGDFVNLGWVQMACQKYIVQVGDYLVCVLCCTKVLLLKYPMRARNRTRQEAHALCACVWILFVVTTAIYTWVSFEKTDNFTFNYDRYVVAPKLISVKTKNTLAALHLIAKTIPTLVVIMFTVPTIRHLIDSREASRRGRGRLRWQGILTVTLTAVIFCVASLPKVLVRFSRIFAPMISVDLEFGTYVSLSRISHFLMALNIMSNFYIYCLTVQSFRAFIKSKALAVWQSLQSTRCRRFLPQCNAGRREDDEGIAMENLAATKRATAPVMTCSV
jgi:hypothetical protein